MILALDSSTPWLGVAAVEKEEVLFQVVHYTRMEHSLLLLEYLRVIQDRFPLRERLECILVGLGPGSFTGVKVGNMIAKGLAYAFRVPLLGFSVLELLASQTRRLHVASSFEVVVPVIFHRRGEIFWSEFPFPSTRLAGAPRVGSPEEFVTRYVGRAGVLVVTPWGDLFEAFGRAGLSCLHPDLAVPNPLELVALSRERGERGSFENVFTMLPLYGSRIFER
jgi:tRNA threonylcarbamoyladenosine biosynthesis protein TsaB|uniref:tRNA (Adenosine(37)-N6)-threonylcarbamoyltransferase complex dimerization subunit type 1 TsaB n=1 Tax=Candidatus Caldatribacterium californiense TaxID=1454726 RepID=A0A7V3YGB4_9BACT